VAEGDTILRAARRLDAALAGETVGVTAPSPRGRASRVERLDGRTLESVEARGKNLLLSFGDLVLHSHLGMNGSWHVYARGAGWRKPRGAAWAVLRGSEREAVQFGGPTLRVLRAGAVELDPQLAGLGPVVLAPGFETDDAVRSLRTAAVLELGEALLDQGLVAGIGNIFKSEACFAARVDPWRRVGHLPPADLAGAIEAARELMLRAVETGRGERAVYRRAGRPCVVCGTRIRSRGQGDANRTTYWCPRCQAGEEVGDRDRRGRQ
jgi:endonuclease-8